MGDGLGFVRQMLRVYRILRQGSRVRIIVRCSDSKTRLLYIKVLLKLKSTEDLESDYWVMNSPLIHIKLII